MLYCHLNKQVFFSYARTKRKEHMYMSAANWIKNDIIHFTLTRTVKKLTASIAPDFYNSKNTALILVDPLNDFLGDEGKLTQQLKSVGDKVGLVPNLLLALHSAHVAHLKIFYGGDYHPDFTSRPGETIAGEH
jgi:maltooligosyltrehalose synthase